MTALCPVTPQRAIRALWSGGAKVRMTASQGIGAASILVAWFLASGRPAEEDQLPLVALAIVGGLVALAGTFDWLLRGRRAVGRRTRFLLGVGTAVTTASDSPAAGLPTSQQLVAGDRRHFFHRADCPVVKGRGWPAASRLSHEAAGRRPCPGCDP